MKKKIRYVDQLDCKTLANSPDPRTDEIVLDYRAPVERGKDSTFAYPIFVTSPWSSM